METNYTNGPWLLKQGIIENRNVRWIEEVSYNTVARLPDTLIHPDSIWHNARVVAHANLIAAAPELLAALENLLAVNEGEGGTRFHAQDIARAAIAKARGDV